MKSLLVFSLVITSMGLLADECSLAKNKADYINKKMDSSASRTSISRGYRGRPVGTTRSIEEGKIGRTNPKVSDIIDQARNAGCLFGKVLVIEKQNNQNVFKDYGSIVKISTNDDKVNLTFNSSLDQNKNKQKPYLNTQVVTISMANYLDAQSVLDNVHQNNAGIIITPQNNIVTDLVIINKTAETRFNCSSN